MRMKRENETMRRIYTVGLLGFGALVCLSQPPALATVTAEKGSIESVKGYEEFSDAGNLTSDGDSSAGGDHSPQALWWFVVPAVGAWLWAESFTQDADAPGPVPLPRETVRACLDIKDDPFGLIERIFDDRVFPPFTYENGKQVVDPEKWNFICTRVHAGLRENGDGLLIPREHYLDQRHCLAALYAEHNCGAHPLFRTATIAAQEDALKN